MADDTFVDEEYMPRASDTARAFQHAADAAAEAASEAVAKGARDVRFAAEKAAVEAVLAAEEAAADTGARKAAAIDADAAAAAAAAKAAVLRHVSEREAALAALRSLMPCPRGLVARRRAFKELLGNPRALAEARSDLAILLSEVRRTSAAICAAITEWKLTLRSHYAYFASLDPSRMAFHVDGVNYLTRMTTDLAFLPCPSHQDPLLLHWFGEQLPWLLERSSELRDYCRPLDQYPPLAPASALAARGGRRALRWGK